MKIVLIGFMGSGKSSTGAALAEILGVPVIDTDSLALHKSGYPSIKDIFDKEGEAFFRSLEEEVARDLQGEEGIIATGGGVVVREATMRELAKDATVVFLDLPFSAIEKRLEGDTSRPLFRDVVAARRLYEGRLPLYERYASLVVSIGKPGACSLALECTPRDVALSILDGLKIRVK